MSIRRLCAGSLQTLFAVEQTGACFALLRQFQTSGAAADKPAHPLPPNTKRISTPLNEFLPGFNDGSKYFPPPDSQITRTTTLANGARIVTENASGPTASLGIYVNSGSVYENATTSGSSALLELMAFKATKHRSSLGILSEVEKLGSNISANASREQMAYTIDCLQTAIPQALELLCDSVLNPLLEGEELEEQKQRILMLLGNPDANPTLLTEALIRTSYTGGLAAPLIPDPERLPHITPETLRTFLASRYTAPNIVLAAANVDHDQLVRLATPMLSPLPTPSSPPEPEPPSQYTGSHIQLQLPSPEANMIVAFEFKGGWRDVRGAVIMTVLTYLLGGGSSFSSGGPGKGMHSRLYTRVLHHNAVHSCQAFSNTFNGSGLMGVQAAVEPQYAEVMMEVICRELEAVARPVTPIEVQRAQRATISLIHNALESKFASAEDIGRQVLTYGHRISGKEYVEMVESVTPNDIASFVQDLLNSTPSLACYGEGTDRLQYQHLVRRYSPGAGSSLGNRLHGALGFR